MLPSAPYTIPGKRTAGEPVTDVRGIDVLSIAILDNGIQLNPATGITLSPKLQVKVVFAERANETFHGEAHVLHNGALLQTVYGGTWTRTNRDNDTWTSDYFGLESGLSGTIHVQLSKAFDRYRAGYQGNPAVAFRSAAHNITAVSVTINSFNVLENTAQPNAVVTLLSDVTGAYQMRFSNDGGTTWSSWIAYAASYSWQIGSATGTVSVHAQYRSTQLIESAIVSDTLTVTSSAPTAYDIAAYTDSGKGTAISASTAQTDNTPYFEWAAAAIAGGSIVGYSTSIDGSDPSTSVEQTVTYRDFVNDPLDDGTYTFKYRAIAESGTSTIKSFVIIVANGTPAITSLVGYTSAAKTTSVDNGGIVQDSNLYLEWGAVSVAGAPANYYYTIDGATPDETDLTTGTNAFVDLSGALAAGWGKVLLRARSSLGVLGPVIQFSFYNSQSGGGDVTAGAMEARVLRLTDTIDALTQDSEIVDEIVVSINQASSMSFHRNIKFDEETKWTGGEEVTGLIGNTAHFRGTVNDIEYTGEPGREDVTCVCFGSEHWLATHTMVINGYSRFVFNPEEDTGTDRDGYLWVNEPGTQFDVGTILQWVFDNIMLARLPNSESVEIPTNILSGVDTSEFANMTSVPDELRIDGVKISAFLDELLQDEPRYGWRVRQSDRTLIFKSFVDNETPVELTVAGFNQNYTDPATLEVISNNLSFTPGDAVTKVVFIGEAEVQQRDDIFLEEAWDWLLEETWTPQLARDNPTTYGRVGRVYKWRFRDIMPYITYRSGVNIGQRNYFGARVTLYKAFANDSGNVAGQGQTWTQYDHIVNSIGQKLRGNYYPNTFRVGTYGFERIDWAAREIWFTSPSARPAYKAVSSSWKNRYIYGAAKLKFDERIGPYAKTIGPEGSAYTIFGITADEYFPKPGFLLVRSSTGALDPEDRGSIVRDDGPDILSDAQRWLDARKEVRISGTVRRSWTTGPHTDIMPGTPVRLVGTSSARFDTLDARVTTVRYLPQEEVTEYEFTLGTPIQGAPSLREKKKQQAIAHTTRALVSASRRNEKDISDIRKMLNASDQGGNDDPETEAQYSNDAFWAKTGTTINAGASGSVSEADVNTGSIISGGKVVSAKNLGDTSVASGQLVFISKDANGNYGFKQSGTVPVWQ